MNCDNFCDPLIFHLASSSDQVFNWSDILVYDEKPTDLMKFPSACAVPVYFVFSTK